MKKKIFLLAVFVLALIPFYDVKAACVSSTIIEYINADKLFGEEKYEIQKQEHQSYTVWRINNNNFVVYAFYGDSYSIENGKIVGLNNYCKYKECYNDLVGKYIIEIAMHTDDVNNGATPMDDIDFSYNQHELRLIESSKSDSYTYTEIHFKKNVGEELQKSNKIGGSIDDIDEVIEEIPGYVYVDYDVDDYNYGCLPTIIRLYYKSTKQESNETVNISKTKNIKMKSYFKDLEGITTKINYKVIDASIAEVDSEGNIKPLKVGETDIIAEADGIEYTLHLKVTEDMIASPDITNPETSSTIAIVLGMISSLILVTVYFKMTKKEHE